MNYDLCSGTCLKKSGIYSVAMFHVGMDCAPFKKPSRLAGLFSYRSVIPPSPHKTLLRKFLRGPRRPAGWPTQAVYRLRRLFFCKIVARSFCCSISAQEPPHMRRLASKRARGRSRFARKSRCAGFPGDPAALPGGNALRSIQKAQPFDWAFLIPLRHSSFSPQNFAAQTFAGPRRPVLHSKRPSLRPGVSCAAGAKSSNPETLAPLSEHFPAPSPYFCPACRRKLWHYSQLRTHVFVWYDDPRNIKQERNLKICLRTNGKA